jgi:hypothetical protein
MGALEDDMIDRNRHERSFTGHVSWTPAQLLMAPHPDGVLYRYRDPDGVTWWSDGYALFQGEAPDYLREAYRAAALPVDAPGEPLMLALVRDEYGTPLGPPIASYDAPGAVLVVVFAATEHGPELHVDARYLAYAEARFNTPSFRRVRHTVIAVHGEQGLVGIIAGRGRDLSGGRP